MKKSLLFAVAMLLGMPMVRAQQAEEPEGYEYVPIVREGVRWKYVWLSGFCGVGSRYFIQMKGETTLNGKTYKRCYRTPYDALNETNDFVGLIREENKKVYCIHYRFLNENPRDNAEELMLYDFGAKVGELFTEAYGGFTVEKIEYVRFRDGKLRKMIHAAYGKFVEGLGRVDLQNYGDLLQVTYDLLSCFGCLTNKLESVISVSNLQKSCADEAFEYLESIDDFADVEAVEADAPGLRIRQEDGLVAVTADCDCYDRAELSDAQGRTVESVAIAKGGRGAEIATEGLASGVYVVSLTGKTGKISQKIYIK